MKSIVDIIKEEVYKLVSETYEDVGIDYVKNSAKKLNDYTDYKDKKVVNDITYLNFVNTYTDDWFIWGEIKAFDNADGTEVGNASYGKQNENLRLKASVDVRPDKRRLGIASNMYKWIEELTNEKLYPDVPHSQLAAKFWDSPKRTFGYDKINEEMSNYTKDTIYNDVANFVKKNNYGSLINSCDLSKGTCDTITKKLYEYLLSLGYDDNKLLTVDLLNPKFDTAESHPEWQKFDKKYLVHTMLQVGDYFIDLTGSQYSQSQAGIKVYTKQELGSLWGNYKIMKKDVDDKYIGGDMSKAKLRKF